MQRWQERDHEGSQNSHSLLNRLLRTLRRRYQKLPSEERLELAAGGEAMDLPPMSLRRWEPLGNWVPLPDGTSVQEGGYFWREMKSFSLLIQQREAWSTYTSSRSFPLLTLCPFCERYRAVIREFAGIPHELHGVPRWGPASMESFPMESLTTTPRLSPVDHKFFPSLRSMTIPFGRIPLPFLFESLPSCSCRGNGIR